MVAVIRENIVAVVFAVVTGQFTNNVCFITCFKQTVGLL